MYYPWWQLYIQLYLLHYDQPTTMQLTDMSALKVEIVHWRQTNNKHIPLQRKYFQY